MALDPEIGFSFSDVTGFLSDAARTADSIAQKINGNPVMAAVASAVPGLGSALDVVKAAHAVTKAKDVSPALQAHDQGKLPDAQLVAVLQLVGLDPKAAANVVALRKGGAL